MATLLKTLTANGSQHHSFTLDVYHIDTDVSGNTSYISWNFTMDPIGTGWRWEYNNGSPVTYTVTVNGQSWSGKIMKYDGATTDFYIADATRIPVVHNTDGSKSINFSFSISSANAYYLPGSASASGSAALPKIPRASTFSCSTADIGSQATITINKQDSSFNHILTYKFGSLSGTISNQTSLASIKWTIPTGFYAQIPNGTSGTGTITCQTIYNGSVLGSNSASFKVTTNKALCEPTLNPTVSCDDATYALTGSRDKFIKGYSGAVYNIGAAARNSATLLSQRALCGNVNSTNMSGTLTPVESAVFEFRAYDSRKYYVEKRITKTLIDYVKPTISVAATNPTAAGEMTITISGNCFAKSFGAATNSIKIGYRIWENGEIYRSYTPVTPTYNTTDNTYSVSIKVTGLEYRNSYSIQADIRDSIYTNYKYSQKITVKSIPVFDWSDSDFNFNVPVTVNGVALEYPVEIGNSGIWNYIKYSTGRCELWGKKDVSSLACTTAIGGLYRTALITVDTYPFEVIDSNVTVSFEADGTGAIPWATANAWKSRPPTYYLMRPTTATITGSLVFRVIGKWE